MYNGNRNTCLSQETLFVEWIFDGPCWRRGCNDFTRPKINVFIGEHLHRKLQRTAGALLFPSYPIGWLKRDHRATNWDHTLVSLFLLCPLEAMPQRVWPPLQARPLHHVVVRTEIYTSLKIGQTNRNCHWIWKPIVTLLVAHYFNISDFSPLFSLAFQLSSTVSVKQAPLKCVLHRP